MIYRIVLPAVSGLALAQLASAQLFSSCNPVLGETCPPNPALGEEVVDVDFRAGASDHFTVLAGTPVTYDAEMGAVFQMATTDDSPTIVSNDYIFFGHVDVVFQAAPGPGIITAITLQSDDLDEIDWEWVGYDGDQVQSNYFAKGFTGNYDRGAFHDIPNSFEEFHTYSLDWTSERLQWILDGVVVRTLTYAEVGDSYPQTPSQVRLGTWVAGKEGASEGTLMWAGGLADFSEGPSAAYMKSVTITDYSNGVENAKEYLWTDDSGSFESIEVIVHEALSEEPLVTLTPTPSGNEPTDVTETPVSDDKVTNTPILIDSETTDIEVDATTTDEATPTPTEEATTTEDEDITPTPSGSDSEAFPEEITLPNGVKLILDGTYLSNVLPFSSEAEEMTIKTCYYLNSDSKFVGVGQGLMCHAGDEINIPSVSFPVKREITQLYSLAVYEVVKPEETTPTPLYPTSGNGTSSTPTTSMPMGTGTGVSSGGDDEPEAESSTVVVLPTTTTSVNEAGQTTTVVTAITVTLPCDNEGNIITATSTEAAVPTTTIVVPTTAVTTNAQGVTVTIVSAATVTVPCNKLTSEVVDVPVTRPAGFVTSDAEGALTTMYTMTVTTAQAQVTVAVPGAEIVEDVEGEVTGNSPVASEDDEEEVSPEFQVPVGNGTIVTPTAGAPVTQETETEGEFTFVGAAPANVVSAWVSVAAVVAGMVAL